MLRCDKVINLLNLIDSQRNVEIRHNEVHRKRQLLRTSFFETYNYINRLLLTCSYGMCIHDEIRFVNQNKVHTERLLRDRHIQTITYLPSYTHTHTYT